jgi:hypothetical protein
MPGEAKAGKAIALAPSYPNLFGINSVISDNSKRQDFQCDNVAFIIVII